jgi:hypothetical protein
LGLLYVLVSDLEGNSQLVLCHRQAQVCVVSLSRWHAAGREEVVSRGTIEALR